MSTRRRIAAAIAAALVLVVAVNACIPPGPAAPMPTPGTIDVMGDSLTVTATNGFGWGVDAPAGQCPARHAPQDPCIDIDGTVWLGMSMAEAGPVEAQRVLTGRPATLILALATNDASAHAGGADGWSRADLDRWTSFLARVHLASCVVIVLPGYGPGLDPKIAHEMHEARDDLVELAGIRGGRTVLADWQHEVDTFAASGRPLTGPDGVHMPDDPARPGYVVRYAAEQRTRLYWAAAAQCRRDDQWANPIVHEAEAVRGRILGRNR